MSKRKRQNGDKSVPEVPHKARKMSEQESPSRKEATHIQIITGSYERVLHGVTATLSSTSAEASQPSVQFVDTFLLNAHTSAIRSLALSPLPDVNSAESPKVILATGSTDERINLYHISARPVSEDDKIRSVPTLAGNKILENPKNREIGSLMHHSSSITALHFPTRSKLLSAAEDNNIAITRTRDWTVISTIKAPRPKAQGRPSGDTAPPGTFPAGVNDFAVHPSMKLMVSVGKGEKCMRLWNLVTGKKAGVLSFGKDVLQSVLEGKHSNGEGRRIEWSPDGGDFAIAFERGVVIYGTDSEPKSKVLPYPLTKLHQVKYVTLQSNNQKQQILAVSTEDGRIVFYRTTPTTETKEANLLESVVPDAVIKAQLGGKASGSAVRIKSFEVLQTHGDDSFSSDLLIVTGSSDGAIKLWTVSKEHLLADGQQEHEAKLVPTNGQKSSTEPRQVGTLLGSYETGNRITCLKAFVMLPPKLDEMDSDLESEGSFEGFDNESGSSSEAELGDQ